MRATAYGHGIGISVICLFKAIVLLQLGAFSIRSKTKPDIASLDKEQVTRDFDAGAPQLVVPGLPVGAGLPVDAVDHVPAAEDQMHFKGLLAIAYSLMRFSLALSSFV